MTVDNLLGHGSAIDEAGLVVPPERVLDIRVKIANTNLSRKFRQHSGQDQRAIINFVSTYLDFFDEPTDERKDIYSQCLKTVEAKPIVREMAVWLAPRVREQIRKNSSKMNTDDS